MNALEFNYSADLSMEELFLNAFIFKGKRDHFAVVWIKDSSSTEVKRYHGLWNYKSVKEKDWFSQIFGSTDWL